MSTRTPRVTASGNSDRPIRIELPDREPLDMTRDELAALVPEARGYLIRTFADRSLGRISNSGG